MLVATDFFLNKIIAFIADTAINLSHAFVLFAISIKIIIECYLQNFFLNCIFTIDVKDVNKYSWQNQ